MVEIGYEIRDIKRVIKFFVLFKLVLRLRVSAFGPDIEKGDVTEDPVTKVINLRGREVIRMRETSQNKKKRIVIKKSEQLFKGNKLKMSHKDQRSKNINIEQSFTTSMVVKRNDIIHVQVDHLKERFEIEIFHKSGIKS